MALRLLAVLLVGAVGAASPRYLVVPGASGFLVDMFVGGEDVYQFSPPRYLENRGHVGTWMSAAPRDMEARGAVKVLPRFLHNATLAAKQAAFEAGDPPDLAGPLAVAADYAFYNTQSKARRMEMVFDAVLNETEPLLVVATSEGGAIVQKLLESDAFSSHAVARGHRIALVSPAYAVGDKSILEDPFYARAGLSPKCWWVCDQKAIYARGVPLHVVNNDIGFASLQGMATNTSGVSLDNYLAMLDAGATVVDGERADPALTWDYYPGAPHSLPACDTRRPASADAGVVNGLPCEGYYAGGHGVRATRDLAALYAEHAAGARWSASTTRAFASKTSTKTGGVLAPQLDAVFAAARAAEVAAARAAFPGSGGDDDDAALVRFRVSRWKGRENETAACLARVEAERAANRNSSS